MSSMKENVLAFDAYDKNLRKQLSEVFLRYVFLYLIHQKYAWLILYVLSVCTCIQIYIYLFVHVIDTKCLTEF
jgi:hypothetical protein